MNANLEELESQVRAMRRTVRALAREVLNDGPTAAQVIAHTYEYADADDATANAKGAEVLRRLAEVRQLAEQIDALLKYVGGQAVQARAAAQEADKKRGQSARRLRV